MFLFICKETTNLCKFRKIKKYRGDNNISFSLCYQLAAICGLAELPALLLMFIGLPKLPKS
jgi:hypothetical protein